jgi:CO/xanthine dehydrogenase Mo-binding subunit
MTRREDHGLLTGRTHFVADLPFDGLHAAFVRSTHAHGSVESIDADAARSSAGVIAVETGETLDLDPLRLFSTLDPNQASCPLARDRVRHVGEAVAVVIARTPEAAVDAAELVERCCTRRLGGARCSR